jgi:uncharacterized repeat protein (TIGR01451 family)
MKSFSVARNAGVLAQIPLAITITHSLPLQGGYPRTTVGSAALSGFANAVETRSVLVNGAPATWSAWEARWTATASSLQPGINRVLVQSLDANGREFERRTLDIWHDDGAVVDITEDLNDDVTWLAADGPFNITTSFNVPAGYTLTIEAGTTVYIAPGASITVRGRLAALGTEAQHIHIGRNPAAAGNWGSLDFIGTTAANRLAYVDFDSGGGTTIGGHNAQIHVNNSVVHFDHCTWPPAPVVQYISFDNSSFIVQNCIFPTYPAPTGPEMLHGVNGIPFSGYGIFRDNYFGHTWGFNDTIDFTGGHRPGAILQIIGNVFDGASDDHLDLDSTDAWIEGNIFMHAHRDPTRTDNPLDTASAISGGVDVIGQNSDWTIINNLFYDVDHVVLNKGNSTTTGNAGGRVAFLYNTVAHVARENSGSSASEISVFNWSDNNVVPPDPAIGSGMYAAHNIIFDAPVLQRLYSPANHTVIFENNIFPATWKSTTNEWTGPGTSNQYTDPRLNISALAGIAPTNVTPAQLRQAFQLRPGSPAAGAGFGGRNIGGLNPYGIAIAGAPTGTNTTTSATLTVGPGGIFDWGTNAPQPFAWTAFKWKLDNGPWSAIIPITNTAPFTNLPTITLSNLSNGPHTVYVSGRNDVGWFQDDPFVYPTNALALLATNATPTALAPNRGQPTATRTWVVDTNFARLVINEVLAQNTSTAFIDGKYPDLIELHNAGAKSVDLTDLSITDDPLVPRKYIFPSGTSIAPGGYLVLYAANGETPGRLYLGFALNNSGEGVYLYDRPASGGALVDSIAFGLQLPDLSIGRLGNGTWGLTKPTFGFQPGASSPEGAANIAQPTGDPKLLRINEWLAASGEIFPYDFIELYNTDGLPVPLGNLALSHSPISAPRQSVIPALSFIAANGWQSFIADGGTGADHVNFKLSAEGGWIGLADVDGHLIDMIVYATQFPDVSQGRSPDGSTTYASFNQPTPGGGNPGATIVISAINTTHVPLNQTWRMEASGIDLGTGWRANNYNDSGWFSGPALFYNYDGGGTQPPPIPQNSVIPFTNPKQTTVYFRTAFNYAGPLSGVNFYLSQVIDDGCVLFLNGQEVYRFGFAPGVTVTYSSRPATVSGGAPLLTGIALALPNLVAGVNYLAIEVHQATATSSDMSMAIGIESQQLVTNYVGTPVVLNEVFTKNNTYTNASGKIVDWVELYNPSTNVVDISGLSLSDEPSIPRRWVFPQGATIAPSGYYVIEFDDSLPYSPFNAGFELSADSGAVYLFQRAAAGGGLLDSVVYGVQVADLSLSRATPGANLSWTLGQPTRGAANVTVPLGSATALKINEWMPNPPSGEEDWFELFNSGSQPVALGGLHLTDDTSAPLKHTIRALSFIGAGTEAWLKFIADNDTSKGGDHVGFRLANTESIGLYTAPAVPSQLDFISYVNAQNGVSQGRLPDGNTSNIVYFPNSPSPEEANWLPLLNSVVINEALTHPLAPLEQAIELRNSSDVDVAIGGWFLSNAKKDLKRYLIPPGTLVPAGGFRNFYEAQFNPGNDVPPSFAFNFAKDDEVILSVADANGNLTGYRTRVKFGASAENVSFGRYEKSTGDDFVAMSARTFGVDSPSAVGQFRTGAGAPNAYPLVGPLVINEVHYHPPDGFAGTDNTLDEFIEILNASAAPAPLFDESYPTNTWRLRDAVDFNFPTNLIVPAWGYVVVVGFSPTTNNGVLLNNFLSNHGLPTNVVVLGPWIGKLDNSSDSIELLRPDSPVPASSPDAGLVPYILVERVRYSDSAPWPSDADGNTNGVGISLQRLVAMDYGNDPVNWVAGVPTPGGETGPAAGQAPTINSGPSNLVVFAGSNVIYRVTAAGSEPLLHQWRFNGAALPGATNGVLIVPNAQAANAGNYSVTVANKWGVAFSGQARLSVQAPPLISQQPQSRTVLAGADTTFIVTASGGALQYQWRFNGTNILGATNAALTVTNAQLSTAGAYDVRVNNNFGATTSLVATLTVLVPPFITTQPQSLTVIIGQSASFMATASGTLPLRYQWRFNGTNLAGATTNSLMLSNVQPANAGNYTLVVTNVAGAITSAVAVLAVRVPPTVTVVASDANASEPGPDTGTFTFNRTGSPTQELTIYYTVSGSAGAGSDYIALSGSIAIPQGVAGTNVIVTPLNDPSLEGDETVIVTLASNPDYLIGGAGSATVVIRDDDNLPPAISILTPTNNQLFLITPTNVSFTVSTSDADGTIAKVEFFSDATNKLGESTVSPFNFTWTNAPAGSNTLTARATDNLGSTALSAPVAAVLNALPSVSIVSPVNGATFTAPATFNINAFASDADGTVTQVIFYANASFAGADASAPFSGTLTNAAAGTYGLRAVAFDNRGVNETSAVVTVVVNQPGVFDDFEPDIDLSQWSVFGGLVGTDLIATNYGGSVSGVRSLWFGGDGPRLATTRAVNTTLGGTIAFQLRIAGASGGGTFWEQADLAGEGVVLEYSVNGGGAWTVMGTFDTFGAAYTLGWTAQQFPIPGAAQTGSTLFRWRQLSHSGGCCDHWALDDVQVLVGPTPPTISTPPSDQYAVTGGTASFGVTVFGSQPLYYQWRHGASAQAQTNVLNGTNATLLLNNVTTNQAGLYSVLVTNLYGRATSGVVSLTVVAAGGDYFRVLALTANGSSLVEHGGATGDDRGGVATSGQQVFVTGDSSTARFAIGNLGGGTSVGARYDALVGDLRAETAYALGTNAVTPAVNVGGGVVLTHLLELNGNTGGLSGNAIALSTPIALNGSGNYGFFSGYGRVVVHNGARVYHVALPSGIVSDLGAMNVPPHSGAESWGYWGVAELDTNGVSLVYVLNSQNIVRTRVPSGVTSTLATFSSLSDMASFTVSVPRARWYFHHEGGSQFGGSDESVGYADAQFALSPGSNVPPVIVIAPQNTETPRGSNAFFMVAALGTPALGYQWYFDPQPSTFNPQPIPGAVAPNLAVLNVQGDKLGIYTVVVTNQFGAITSAPVSLAIVQPAVDHFEFSAVPSPQLVNVPFSLTLTARDASNRVVTNFEGALALGGVVQSGSVSTSILAAPVHQNTFSSDYTLGYSFTPSVDITVTAVRHYFGVKVSLWTDAEVLLAAQPVVSVPGTWRETALGTPVSLSAGTRYRVAAYSGGGDYYWREDGLPEFPHGTIDGSWDISGDGFPASSDSVRWWFVDLRYIVGTLAPVAIAPTNSGVFSNGVWTGGVTVLEPAANMFLAARGGQRGASAPFDVVVTNDLGVVVADGPDPLAVGGYLTNIITLTNSGPTAATSVIATNFLPAAVTFISVSASQGSCALVGGRVECSLGSLAAGERAIVTVVTIPTVAGPLTNRIAVGRAEVEGYYGNNTAQSVTTVLAPAFGIGDSSVLEGHSGFTPVVFSVRLFPPSPTNVSVSFATSNGTAQAGSDYVATNGVLVFAPGQTNGTITVQVMGDATAEPHETFSVVLSGALNASIGDGQGVGTIFTDDLPPDVYLRSTAGAPWGSMANETAMNRVFGSNNWQDLRYETVDPAGLFTPATRFIFMEGSETTALEMQAFLSANLTAIENWVGTGGRLFLNAAPSEGSGMNFGFGVSLFYSDNTSSASAADALHPIFLGPFTPVGLSWTGGSFGHATVRGGDVTALVTNAFNGNAVLGQKRHGAGLVLFGGMTTDNFHSPQPEASNLRANILGYTATFVFCSNCAPSILTQPLSRRVRVGTNVSLSVVVGGTAPFVFQWQRGGVNLTDGGRISGATTAVLTLSNCVESDSGLYSVMVSNAFGTATSSNATLVVSRLDHFTWSVVPSPQVKDVPFAVVIEARDASNVLVTNFQDRVALSGAAGGGLISNTILPAPLHDNVSSGNFTLGYSFIPNTNITVRAVRHYSGTKVSIWTDAGVLLAAQSVSSVPGTWVETALATPVSLTAGTRYRVASYTGSGSGNYYWPNVNPITFPHGTIDEGYEASGDAFPANADGIRWFVDLRYTIGSSVPVPMAPALSGNFVDGLWSGDITVLRTATNVTLLADYFGEFTGRSNPFNVASSNQAPIIVTQPAARSVRPGTNASFSVSVFGTPPLTYQWRRSGTNLANGGRVSGATTAVLTISNSVESDSGPYSVLVSNVFGTALSSNAAFTVSQVDYFTWSVIASPQGTNLPFSVTIQARDFANQLVTNFTGTVSLSGPAAVVPATSGVFSNGAWSGTIRILVPVTNMVVVANDGAEHLGASNPFHVVRPNQAPIIVSQPLSQVVRIETNLSVSVNVFGSAPLSYQWRRNGTNLSNGGRISGATSATLVIANAAESDSASYSVSVSNPSGTAVSVSAFVTVKALDHFAVLIPSRVSTLWPFAVTIEARDFSNRVVTGFSGSVGLSAYVASSGTPVSLSPGGSGSFVAGVWRGNLSISQVVSNVVVRADDFAGGVGISAPFDVARVAAFTVQPTNQNVLPGTNVTLAATAIGTGPVRYQWRFEGTNILDATNNTYTFTGANLTNHHGNFTVVATDDISSTESLNAFIYVLVKPGVVTHITSQTVLQGGTATFSLVATGAPPLGYRWVRNGGTVPGATTSVPVLVITNVQASGTIRVAVTNVALPNSGVGAFSPGPSAGNNVQLIMLADVDGDGMWDAWETNYFGAVNTTNNAANALQDPDGDGMSNLDEYRAGTIPTNALSLLKIVLTATNANVLEFVAQTNLTYSVQSRTNFAHAVWNNMTNITSSASVRTIRVDSATSPFADERYYRVVTPLAP